MIRTTSEAFLGLTVGCARCHNHKFDPVTQADYYALYATFAGVQHGERPVASTAQRAERAAKIAPLELERDRLAKERSQLEEQLKQRQDALLAEVEKTWVRPRASRYGTAETFEPVVAKFVKLTVEGTDAPDDKPGFRIDEFEVFSAENEPRNVASAALGATAEGAAREPRDFKGAYGAALVIDGKFGERWHAAGTELKLTLAQPTRIARVFFSSDRLRALGEDYPLTVFVGDYRIDVSEDGKTWHEVASSADRQPATPARKTARLRKLATTPEHAAQVAELDRQSSRIAVELSRVPPLPVWWVGTRRDAPGPFRIFQGGDPQKPRDEIFPASPSALDDIAPRYKLSAQTREADRRLALANWLTSPDNPLTLRVLANRVWHYHFGCGIVDTPSDFGYMGGRPTHPELLDSLAQTLRSAGWRLKPLHRLIVLSQAYRQSSEFRADAARSDGESRYLWRFPPRRLAAEEVRDSLLFVAGKLDLRQFGPGYRLYEYQQDNVATYVPLDSHGPHTYRRAVYHQNARAARVDLMSEFDCPDNAFAAPRRAATTTPLQALTLLNHQFTLDMASALADRLQREAGPDPRAQIERGFALTLGRRPAAEEAQAAENVVREHGLRALTRALLNASEFLYIR